MDDEQRSTVDDTMQDGSEKGKKASKKITDATKKGWKKIKSIKKLAPLVSAISSIAIVLLIIFLVVGFIGFFITLPGLAMDKIIEACKGFWDWFTGAEKIEIDKSQIIELGEYIENLGYDLVGNGFVTKDKLEKDPDTGKILDIKYDGEDDDRDYLYAYVLQNERIYTARQVNVTGLTKLVRWIPGVGDAIVNFENWLRNIRFENVGPENYGMLVFDDGTFDKGSASDGDFKVEIDREKMVMKVTTGFWVSHQFEWDLDGWTGRYGKPIELSLALHLSTMAPDFAYNFCMDKDLQTNVYLTTHPVTYNASYKYAKNLSDGTRKEISRGEVIKKYESVLETSRVLSFISGLQAEDAKVLEDTTGAKRQMPIGVLDNVNIVEYNDNYYRVIDKDGKPLRVFDSNGEGILYKATVQTDKIVFEQIDIDQYYEIEIDTNVFLGSLWYNSETNTSEIIGYEGKTTKTIELYCLCLNEGIELLDRNSNWAISEGGTSSGYFNNLVNDLSPFTSMKSDLFQAVDSAIEQYTIVQNGENNKKLPESMQLKLSFVRGDTTYYGQLYNLYNHDKMENPSQEYKEEVIQKLKDIRTNIKKDYNTLIQNADKVAELDMGFIDEWEMDSKTFIALYKVMTAQQSTVKTYQPYIKYVNHHWYKDVYFDSSGLDDYHGPTINVYDFKELIDDNDYEVYDPEGLASSEEVDLLKQEGELFVKLDTTDDTTTVVQKKNAQPAIIKTEPWHYKVKNWLTSGYFFIYDGTQETAEKIEEAKEILKNNSDYNPSDPLLGVNGTEGLLTNDDKLKDKFGTNADGEIIIDVNAGSKIEDIDAKAKEYNGVLENMGSSIRLQKINFAKKSSLEAFSILESVHTKDAELVYRDLKEFLIELGYFTRGDFDAIESGILDWMIPGFTPDNWPMPKYGDELYEYGNIIRYGVNKASNDSLSGYLDVADKVMANIIKHKLPYNQNVGHDTTSYLTDNPSSTIDCSAYVSAVLYEYDKEKYSRFATQQSTYAWYPNAEEWAKEYGWTIMKQDGSITVDKLKTGDIILQNGNGRNHVEIFMEAVDTSNPKSAGYMYNCGWAWWNDKGVIDGVPLYKNDTSAMWTNEGAYIIRLNDTEGSSGTSTGETSATLGGPYDSWLDAAAAVKAHVAQNGYTYGHPDPRNSKVINCASYVSWALLEYGYDDCNNGVLINGCVRLQNWLEANGFEEVFNGQAGSEEEVADLQPGDIILFGWNSDASSLEHTAIYVGKNEKGEHIYYDCGSDGSSGGFNKIGAMPGEDNVSGPYGPDHYISYVYRVPGEGSTAGITSLDDFLFIGDSRTHQIESKLQALGENITAIGVGASTPEHWIDTSKNKKGTVYNESVTLPDKPKGIVVQGLGVNGAATDGQLDRIKTVINNLLQNYPNTPIFVTSIYKLNSNYGSSADAMNSAVDSLNSGLSDFCKTNSMLYYIDVQAKLNDDQACVKKEYCDDGLHLNSEGQDILVENIKKGIFSAVKSSSQKNKPNGFEADMDVVCPGECRVVSVSEQSIKLQFGVQHTSYNKNLINGYTLYIEGFQVDTINITEGMSLKRGDVMGVTLRQDIKLILMDDKKAILNNIEDYMKPSAKGSASGINNVYGGNISASENGIRTKEDILYAIDKAGWPENRKKNVEEMMDGLLRLQSDFDLDPLVAIALFCGESGVGTAYESSGQYRLDNHMHWEGCKCSYHQSQGFACYDNYSDNAYDWGNYIRNRFDPPITTWDEMANYNGMTIYENCNVDDGGHAISIYKKLIEALETK